MSNRRKAGIAKVTALFLIAAIALQAVFLIHPLTTYILIGRRYIEGVCNVTAVHWVDYLCVRNSKIYNVYSVPVIQGIFNKIEGRPPLRAGHRLPYNNETTHSFEQLFISNKYSNNYNWGDLGGGFIYDDLSSDAGLYNCSTTPYTSITDTITKHLPNLEGMFEENSYDVKLYPATYFNCTYDDNPYPATKPTALLFYARVSIFMVIPFAVSFIALFSCIYLIAQHDDDGPAKEMAQFLLAVLYMVVMVVNFVFYLIIRVGIMGVLFNRPPGDPEEFLKRGSVCFPVVWLVKHCIERCKTPLPPPPEPPDTSQPVPANTRAHVPPPRSATPPPLRRHSSSSDSNTPERRNSAPTVLPFTEPVADPTLPPSYNNYITYSEGVVIPNYIADVDSHGMVLPPPPSYDDVVKNDV